MTSNPKIIPALCRAILAVVFLLGYHGTGHADNNEGRITINDIPDIDIEHVLDVYIRFSEEENDTILNTQLNWLEQLEMPVIVGHFIQKTYGKDILKDSIAHRIVNNATNLMKASVALLDNANVRPLLYLSSDSLGMIPVKFLLANALEATLNFKEADSLYVTVTTDVRNDFGEDSDEYVSWTNRSAANIFDRFRNYQKAIEVMKPALEAALYSPKVKAETSVAFLISYCQKLQRMGRHTDAMTYAAIALERAYTYSEIYWTNRIMGELLVSEGKYDQATAHFETSAKNSPSLGEFLANSYSYVELLKVTGKHDEAINILEELSKYIDSQELDNVDRFNYYENLGVVYTFIDSKKSSEAFKKSEEYLNFSDKDALIRHILNSQVYPNSDNYYLMISAIDRAMFIYNNLMKVNPRLSTELCFLLGYHYFKVRNYHEAEEYLVSAFMGTLSLATSDPFVDRVLDCLIQVYKSLNKIELWKSMVGEFLDNTNMLEQNSNRRLYAISSALDYAISNGDKTWAKELYDDYSRYRKDDFDTKRFAVRIATLKKRFSEAERLLNEIEAKKDDTSPSVDDLWIDLYAKSGNAKVAFYARRRFENYKNDLTRQLLFMNSMERRNLNEELKQRRDEAIELIKISPEMIEVAMDYSLLIKGLLLKTHTHIESQLSELPQAQEDYKIVQSLRMELNKAESHGNEEQSRQLRYEIGSRERYIINDYIDQEKYNDIFAINSSKTLIAKIDKGQVYVDIVEFTRDNETRCGMFAIDGDTKKVEFIDISDISKAIEKPSLICHAIERHYDNGSEIWFCPDGHLSSTPFEYASDKNGIPYFDKFRIHRVFNLCDISRSGTIGDNIAIVGVSDHNSPVGDNGVSCRGDMVNLPNVEYEIDLITKRISPHKPQIFFNDNARESEIKRLSGTDLSLLHISTHGFFRNRDALLTAVDNPEHDDHHIAKRMLAVNKQELSGIVLREGNINWHREDFAGEEDDLLTAEEIELMSFPNLQLTVLSACDTGLGYIDSDGVWGLQRAFRIAGTRSLICSLSKVDDYWTAQFMDAFYEQASQGKTIYDSFHTAQRWLCRELPDNPEIWSSFILIE